MNENNYDKIIAPIVEQYAKAETNILIDLSTVLGRDKILLERDAEAWKNKQLTYLAEVTKDSRNQIGKIKNEPISKTVIEEVDKDESAYKEAQKHGAKLEQVVNLNESVIINVLKGYDAVLFTETYTARATMLKGANSTFISAVNAISADMLKGNKSINQAMADTIGKMSDSGIPLIDKAGRKWSAEGYTRMLYRTTLQQATTEAQMVRADEYGADLIEVSSHADSRPLCAPYQGRIFSRTGKSDKYPSLSTTSYGQAAGLFGINCRHSWYPYFEGISEQTFKPIPQKEVAEDYKESQKQRYLERQIRAQKRKIDMLKAADLPNVDATQNLKIKQAKMRAFIDETGRTRRPIREKVF